jgi:hypothetical protein
MLIHASRFAASMLMQALGSYNRKSVYYVPRPAATTKYFKVLEYPASKRSDFCAKDVAWLARTLTLLKASCTVAEIRLLREKAVVWLARTLTHDAHSVMHAHSRAHTQ